MKQFLKLEFLTSSRREEIIIKYLFYALDDLLPSRLFHS